MSSFNNNCDMKISPRKLPRIICIGGEALTESHGTGMMFKRHFSRYPQTKIIDVHYQALAKEFIFRDISIPVHWLQDLRWNTPLLKKLNEQVTTKKMTRGHSLIYPNYFFDPVAIDWSKYGGPPDLIYSTCYSARDFSFLHHVYRHLPKKVPIVQHFLDLDLQEYETFSKLYLELLPAMASVWALTKTIKKAVSGFTVLQPELVQALQQEVHPRDKRKAYRPFSKDFRAIIIGNVWSQNAYRTLVETWEDIQKQIRPLPPILWAGHPRRLRLVPSELVPSKKRQNVIRDIGFLSERKFKSFLEKADIAIVAFSGEDDDKENYTTYSLPSRIGDYCARGLPLVVISRPGSEPWRLVEDNNLGITIDPKKHQLGLRKLKYFILDRKWRAECGKNARAFAERELNLKKYQEQLYPRLVDLAKFKVETSVLRQLFRPTR
jgi:glycosyltransferase involved in cell wall biosynthesis